MMDFLTGQFLTYYFSVYVCICGCVKVNNFSINVSNSTLLQYVIFRIFRSYIVRSKHDVRYNHKMTYYINSYKYIFVLYF